tara:strand:- start:227 stop:418 length:192 start_codon:yes stop_codon:yes gene_type:complete
MGRIKTTIIKRTVKKLIEDKEDLFTTKFEENKKLVDQHLEVQSKKVRNLIAGYLTKVKRRTTK